MSSFAKLKYIMILYFLLASCQQERKDTLRIATAANMQFVIEHLTTAFTQQTGIPCETIISSSGKLTAQIKEGAPYDVFLSADLKYPTVLFEENHTLHAPQIYAYGKLVLWSMMEEVDLSLSQITSNQFKHIALANPKAAPYGRAAMEVLNHYEISTQLKDKLVYGESIAQTNQFIVSKAAELGFTSQSVVLSAPLQDQGNWVEIPDSLYAPIQQGVVVLNNRTSQSAEAQQFAHFLFTKKAKNILQTYGYRTSDD